jgi:glycosyltransferase involved in cell wall biosynthesis
LRGLAKYLPEFGWEPIILTPSLPGKPDERFRVIETYYSGNFIKQIKIKLGLEPSKRIQEYLNVPYSLREGRNSITNKLERFISSIISYPSKRRGWSPIAIKTGAKLIKEEDVDAIISSSAPMTTHLIANALKQRFFIPWVSDLRDLWTQDHFYRYSSLRKFFEKRLEIKTLSHSDALVTVSEPLARELGTLHKEKRVFSVTNGFDPDEVQKGIISEELTITYAGNLHRGERDPRLLLKGLRELANEGTVDLECFHIRFYGTKQHWLDQEIKQYNLESSVHQYGRIERGEVLDKQRQSHMLLLLNRDDPKEAGVYTGKFFEYLAAKRPVLAVGGPKGVVSELLEQTKAGFHANDLLTLKEILSDCYKEYDSTGEVTYKGIEEEINKYSHREMARKFAEVLDLVTEKQKDREP